MKMYQTRADLDSRLFGEDLYIPGDPSTKSLVLRLTSGTTSGTPALVINDLSKLLKEKRFSDFFLKPYKAFLRVSSKYSAYTAHAQMLLGRYDGCERVMFLDREDLTDPNLGNLLSEFQPKQMKSTISLLELVWNTLKKQNAESVLKQLSLLLFSGDMSTTESYERIKGYAPNVKVVSEYSLSETNYITFGCDILTNSYPNLNLRVIHPIDSIDISIADADENGVGEVVVTTNELTNYRTGDMGELKDEICMCGAKKTLIIYGRIDFDIVNACGAVFLKEAVEDAFKPFLPQLEDYRVEVSEKFSESGCVGGVCILIVPVKEAPETLLSTLLNHVKKELYITPTRTLGDLVNEGLFKDNSLEVVEKIENNGKRIILKKI